MAADEFAQYGPKIGGNSEVAPLEQLLLLKSRPCSVDFAAGHRATHHHHETAMPMIGAAGAILFNGAAELGHGYNHHVFHAVAKILTEGRDRVGKLIQKIGKLTVLVLMVIPAIDLGKRCLHT